MLNSETISTGNGIIIVESINPKSSERPRKSILAKPYATREEERTVPITDKPAMTSVLAPKRAK